MASERYDMEEEEFTDKKHHIKSPINSPISVCKCLLDDGSSEEIFISTRKKHILSTVARTENYLMERRIPELIRFLLTKVIVQESSKPLVYLEKLIDECMLYRAGHGPAPVIYEDRHLEAVVKSFDPGHRGWLTVGQMRRAYSTLGLSPEHILEENIPTEKVLEDLRRTQEKELLNLVSAGMEKDVKNIVVNTHSSI